MPNSPLARNFLVPVEARVGAEGEGVVAAGRVRRRTLLQCDLFFGSARSLSTSHSAPSPISLTMMPPTARSLGASYYH